MPRQMKHHVTIRRNTPGNVQPLDFCHGFGLQERLVGDLKEWLGRNVPVTFFNRPTWKLSKLYPYPFASFDKFEAVFSFKREADAMLFRLRWAK